MVRRDLRYKTLKFVNDDLPKLVNNKDLKGATNALGGKISRDDLCNSIQI